MRFGRHFLTFRLAAGKRLQLKRDISRKNFYIERIPDGMLCLFIVIVIVVPISGGTSGRTSSLRLNSSISVMSIFRLTCSIASVELNNQTILRSAKAPCIPSNPHVSIWNSIFSKQANRRRKKHPIDRSNVENYLGQILPMRIKRSVSSLLCEQHMCLLAGNYLWARATTDKQKQWKLHKHHQAWIRTEDT